jgi:maltose alpha-D-glucosyltransferase/alpha-amylase
VLFTGRDFIIADFEGDPERSLSERRIKRSPIRDVGSMLHCYHTAVFTRFFEQIRGGMIQIDSIPRIERWCRAWYEWVSVLFLKSYLEKAGAGGFLPRTHEEISALLEAHIIDKAIQQLAAELPNRPDWVIVPLREIMNLLAPEE